MLLNFNPRSPHGERQRAVWKHPSVRYFNPRSPHGERHDGRRRTSATAKDFNPRSPHGERQGKEEKNDNAGKISIHAPRTGSDRPLFHMPSFAQISIHAPRTGSDLGHRERPKTAKRFQSTLPARGATQPDNPDCPPRCDFNPRSPHGERLTRLMRARWHGPFQSTLPARGATRTG